MAVEATGVSMISVRSDVDQSNELNLYLVQTLGPAKNIIGDGQGGAAITPYAAGGNAAFGILQSNPVQGEAGSIMLHGLSRCQAAGAWTVGDKLSVADGGKLQKAGSSDTVFGVGFESAVEGDTSSVMFDARQ